MSTLVLIRRFAIAAAFAIIGTATAQARTIAGVECQTPPVSHCGDACGMKEYGDPGNAVEPKTGRKFFLDYPCDLKPNEKVIFILSIHGAGSFGNWQRHYFPALDYKDKYRLVIATPTAAGPEAPAVRMWRGEADDEYLHNIVDFVFDAFGKKNIKAFWLAGHSQGGITSNRIICTDFFKDKVDGWLSLSGGRIGPVQIPSSFFPASMPKPPSSSPAAATPPPNVGGRPGAASIPTCEFNYIFETGEHEMMGLPETSPLAEKFSCGARVRKDDIVDTKAGYVNGGTRGESKPNPAWGTTARPGTAEVFVYPNCKNKRIVADVERLDKGHTEGLEPKVTEALIKMIASAPGGKVQKLK